MSCRPKLIVFDEPTTALDVTTQIEVLGAIKELIRDFGTAAVYISHDLAIVWNIADDVIVMRHGKVVDSGPKRRIFAPPHDPYTELLLTSAPEMRMTWLNELLETRRARARVA